MRFQLLRAVAGPAARRVLIVEDDQAMAVALRDGFAYEGYEVEVARDGASGLARAGEPGFDLVILDVMLPGVSGLDVCRKLRGAGNNTPVIMLTARGQEIDKVVGLKTGADDYVTKPFSFMELLARAEAVLRRAGGGAKNKAERPQQVSFADVVIDFKRQTATKKGAPIELSPREFKIMHFFSGREDEVVTREELLAEVWGYEEMPLTRTVDMHIAKLRQKIEDVPADPRHILTIHRVGYRFVS